MPVLLLFCSPLCVFLFLLNAALKPHPDKVILSFTALLSRIAMAGFEQIYFRRHGNKVKPSLICVTHNKSALPLWPGNSEENRCTQVSTYHTSSRSRNFGEQQRCDSKLLFCIPKFRGKATSDNKEELLCTDLCDGLQVLLR